MKRLKILVYGAGAIGCVFGGFLSRQHDVTLLGRSRIVHSIRRHGLLITGIWGRHRFHSLKTVTDRQAIPKSLPFDLILLTVKSYDTASAAAELRHLAGPHTKILSLQNGLGNLEELTKKLGASAVLGGRVIFGAETLWIGSEHKFCVKITVSAEPTSIGEAHKRIKTARVVQIAKVFAKAGIPCHPTANIQQVLWAKVIYNCALNPLASFLGCHYGYLGQSEDTRKLMEAIIREIYELAAAEKIKLNPTTSDAYIRIFYKKLLPRTFHHHPSMLQDLRNGKPTEIMALNGAVVRLAQEHGVQVPVNRFCMKLILEKGKKHE